MIVGKHAQEIQSRANTWCTLGTQFARARTYTVQAAQAATQPRQPRVPK